MNETDNIGRTGVPMLPVKQISILLPQNGSVESVNVTYSNNISLGNGYNVTPCGILTNQSEGQQNPYNESLFNSSSPYPTYKFEDFGISYFRGYAILMCHLYPVHYINDTGNIYYYENMTLNITTNNTGSVSNFFRGVEEDEIKMKQKVDDYSMNYTYASYPDLPEPSSLVNEEWDGDYVIITSNSLKDSSPIPIDSRDWYTFQDLADYKNEELDPPVKTKIVTVEEIYEEPVYTSNVDNQEKIRHFIKEAYQNWGIEYVLLGGDIDIVPARDLCYDSEDKETVPSDLYYACLDGTYNANKNEYWGEPQDGETYSEEDPDQYEPWGGGTYYVEAEPCETSESYKVGLFTPSLNCENLDVDVYISFRSYFIGDNSGDLWNVSTYTGGKHHHTEKEVDTGDEEPKHYYKHIHFNPKDLEDPSDISIQFFYCSDSNGGSFNLDDVRIWYQDGDSVVVIFEDSFEEKGWLADGNSKGWTQVKYDGKKGDWEQEEYKDDLDLVAEVYVGRASVGDAKEVSNFVYKTLKYDKTPNHEKYIKKALMTGMKAKTGHWSNGKAFMGHCCEEIRNGDTWPYITVGLPKDKYDVEGFYDYIWMNPKNFPTYRELGWRAWWLMNRIKKGVSIINHASHGKWNALLRYFDYKQTKIPIFTNFHVRLLSNDKFFFMYANSCLLGEFNRTNDEDCLAEYLTVKTPNGAFATIMSSGHGYFFGGTDGSMQRYARQFFDALYGEGISELGKAHQDSREDNLHNLKHIEEYPVSKRNIEMRASYYALTLFGDPQISIKTTPTSNTPPNVAMTPEIYSNNGNWYTFHTSTNDSEGDQISYKWKWDDHECSYWSKYYDSGDNVSKTLWLPTGTHQIRVKVRDIYMNESDWSDPLSVTESFDSNIQTASTTAVLGKEIQLSGLASEGTPPYCSWYYDFGDGNNSQQQNTTHTYNTLGSYNVTLNVTDSQNISSNCSIVINTVILNSDFESAPGPAITNLQETFYFNDKSKGYYDIVNWSWDFGDGNTSYQRNTSYSYSAYGAYNVSLNVTDNQSNTDTFYQMIYIDSVSPTIESVSNNFDIVGYGSNITILVNTSDSSCGIKTVKVNITYPNSSYYNYTMDNTLGSNYKYVFSDCWQLGEYSYTVWVVDQANNTNCSTEKSFAVTRMYGYNKIGVSNQTIWNTITGSVFRVNEKCVADNITVYLDPGNATSDYHYSCVIYSHNGSELVGISEEKNISVVKGWQTFNFSVPKPVLLNDTDYVIGCWSNYSNITMYYDNGTGSEKYYDDGNCTFQGHYFEGVYNYTPDPTHFDHEDRRYSIYCCYTPDNTTPEITNVSDSPGTVGFGFNVTISADVSDNQSGVEIVKVNITYPNSTQYSYNMNNVENDTYEYVFNNSWLKGQYNYSIWTVDYMNHSNSSSGHSFNVSAQATISVCTIKDNYGNNETVNLTDPPPGSPGIGYELLDGGEVLHIWNRYDSYYFDTNSGIQLTNHYNEYWSHNVLMLGYYHNNVWKLIYRTDELSGFNKDITSGETHVNATIWKDLSYNGYDFRLAIRYHLGVDDNELTVIPYIKNIDNRDIPYVLGFGWEMKDIQIDMTTDGDYINVNRTSYYLDQTLDNVYTDLSETEFYLMENITSMRTRSLYLKWNPSLTYKLQVKSREGQYNAPVTLFIRIGSLNEGQEKYTHMYWYDAEQEIYYFNNYSTGEAWATSPGYMVDGNPSNPASTTIDDDVELCNSNNCSGTDLGAISKVELRVSAYYTGSQRDTFLQPSFPTTFDGDIYPYQTPTGAGLAWSPWFDITNDPAVPGDWDWDDVQIMDCDVQVGPGMTSFTLYCSQVEIRVTYSPYTPPEISNPYPSNGSIGVSLTPTLNITVSDTDGDNMNITWLSNSGGSWAVFGTNNSVGNGTYHQTMSNASVNGQWWYWKVNVTDGTNYTESNVFKFYTGCQSKMVNTGSTNIKGYLLIQVQFYNETSESWVVADDTINETTPRTVLWEDPAGEPGQNVLGLDTIFNGLVNTSNLSEFGNGTYRIFAAFRDPDGDVLVCDDETLMEDSYEFLVTDA